MIFSGLTLDLNLFLGSAIGLSLVGEGFEFLIIFITNLCFSKMQGYWVLLYLSWFFGLLYNKEIENNVLIPNE